MESLFGEHVGPGPGSPARDPGGPADFRPAHEGTAAPLALSSLALIKAMGAELAQPLHQMTHVLRELRAGRALQPRDIDALEAALDQARGIAIAGQQLARLAEAPTRAGTERMSLERVLQEVLDEARPGLLSRGVEVRQRLRPVEVQAEPSRLALLLDTALQWAARRGHRLMATLTRRAWPDHGLVILRCGGPDSSEAAGPAGGSAVTPTTDNLTWYRLQLLAQALNVQVQRSLAPGATALTLEFLDTVPLSAHLSNLELESNASRLARAASAMPERSPPSQGQARGLAPYLLLVSDDAALQAITGAACRPLGLTMEVADTPLRAHWACARARPAVLVVDDGVHDDALDALLVDLHEGPARPQVIEIASGPEVLTLSDWSLDEAHRLSRASAATRLPLLLGDIWPPAH